MEIKSVKFKAAALDSSFYGGLLLTKSLWIAPMPQSMLRISLFTQRILNTIILHLPTF